MSFKAKLDSGAYFDSPVLFARLRYPNGTTFRLKSLELEQADPNAFPVPVEASARLDGADTTERTHFDAQDFAQAMLDAAWAAGLRPSSIGHVDHVLTATQSHIADLRAVAFKALGIGQEPSVASPVHPQAFTPRD